MNSFYLVMLWNRGMDSVIPLTDASGELPAKFATKQLARDAAQKNPLAQAYGFSIVHLDPRDAYE